MSTASHGVSHLFEAWEIPGNPMEKLFNGYNIHGYCMVNILLTMVDIWLIINLLPSGKRLQFATENGHRNS